MKANSLPFKGRGGVGVGMGNNASKEPIPIPAFPLKGKGLRFITVSRDG
jgi:hypothetical protein